MLISMNWISDFVCLDGIDIHALINRFTLATAEVEDIFEYGKDIEDVVAARILTISNHPNSKKLHILTVDAGNGAVQVVCGAPNVKEGIMVPFAKDGGVVKGQKITACSLAGVQSNGMCCSESELGISDDHDGLMILQDNITPGTPIKQLFNLEDTVFEVDNKSLTNRPDLWGHYGIARELAALCGRPLKEVETTDTDPYNSLPEVAIDVQNKEKCLRYTGIVIKNITRKTAPVNMKIRLFYCGMRSINLLADLTNYLMLELGQPMHAFDNTLVNQITVKTFDSPVSFETLDGTKRTVPADTLMICNGDTPSAVAGVMGGADSEIRDDTTSVLLESANFDGVSIRRASTKLGLRTEASARYEKVLDPELTVVAARRFIKLLQDIDPQIQVASRLTDIYVKHYQTVELRISKAFIDKYTGIEIDNSRILNTLSALGFQVSFENDVFDVIVPSFRATKDVTIKADLIEEITRIYGYDNFLLKTSSNPLVPVRHSIQRESEYTIKQLLAEQFTLSEVHSYIWYNTKLNKELAIETSDNVRIINSVSPETSVLRANMATTLLNIAHVNKSNSTEFGIFEMGRVVRGLKPDGKCNEKKVLGILIASRTATEKEMFYKAKSIVEVVSKTIKNSTPVYSKLPEEQLESWIHPYNSAAISFGGTQTGYLTVLHPAVKECLDKKLNIALIELDMDAFSAIEENPVRFAEISRFPGVEIDLSLLADKTVSYAVLCESLNEYKCEFLNKYELVDVYEDEALKGKKSISIRFYFGAADRTLSGEEVSGYKQDIINMLKTSNIVLR
jgi:phenylalanyl-tRNA synthetase beta chain